MLGNGSADHIHRADRFGIGQLATISAALSKVSDQSLDTRR